MARSWNQTEKSYSQIKRESNGVYCRVVSNRVYLLGGSFMLVVDHNPLIYLNNGMGRPKQARMDRHRMKLKVYRFKMKWEPGEKSPCNYWLRHPPEGEEISRDDDSEIYVNSLPEDQLLLAITRKMLWRETLKDPVMQ